MRYGSLFLSLLTQALLIVHAVFAGTTGKIAGQVVDASSGEPLPGANVIVEGTTLGAATDLEGNFVILRVPPGSYSLVASMIGYTSFRYENVQVTIDKTTRLRFELSETVLEIGEEVTVVAEKPLVKFDVTSTEASVSAEKIKSLPVQRFDEIVNLQAGVVDGHFRGGRLGEVMYMIDGIPVNDVYSGNFAVEVENSAIEELQVISGTFNAEYGQAMSGVVNIVTKEGGERYNGSLTTYFGDYVSNHSDIFWTVESLNPTYNVQGNLSGPLPFTSQSITFFLTSRYFRDDGYIYGREVFLPTDQSNFLSDNPNNWVIGTHGRQMAFTEERADSLMENAEAIPMRPEERLTGQAKLTFKFSPASKLNYEFLTQKNDTRVYDHRFRLNPQGAYKQEQTSFTNGLSFTQLLSDQTFFTVKASHLYTKFRQFAFEDIFDPRYVSADRLQTAGANAFLTSGAQLWHFTRSTTTLLGKADFTSQVTKRHQMKAGVEVKRHELKLREFQVVPELEDRINPITAFNHNRYERHPMEMSFYIQDKMEFEFMIVNAGVRFDLFDPDGGVPVDFQRPGESDLEEAEISSQWSPRFGIAYPMSDRGVIHVSYGHFFQIPNFRFLYLNPEFDIFPLQSTPSPPPFSLLNTVGNAALKPQKTVIYELGLQQQLFDDIALTVTAYNKDIKNLLGTEVLETINGVRYGRFINRDYGNVRGVTVAFEKRYSGKFSASLDYTFQIAEGNASDPNSVFLDQQTDPPIESEKQLVPLDWDRRHQLNLTVSVGDPADYNVSFVGKLGSGFPYTPTFRNVRTAVENSERKPPVYTVDVYAYKNLRIGGLDYQFFIRVFNLFDRLNELEVFTDTGRASYTLQGLQTEGFRIRGLNTEEEFFTRPDFYSAPRQVQAGVTIEF